MRRLALPLITLVIAATVGVVLWLDWRSIRRVRERPEQEASATEASPRVPALAPAPSPDTLSESNGGEPETLPAAKRVESADTRPTEEAAGATEGVLVEGIVIVVDQQGTEYVGTSGSIVATYWDDSRRSAEIPVRDGRFRLRASSGMFLGIKHLELDGRLALPYSERLEFEPGTPLTVRATFVRRLRLHVVDESTEAELRDVTVVASDEKTGIPLHHPGDATSSPLLAEMAVSPIDIEPRVGHFGIRWMTRLFAIAPGHAWRAVDADFRADSELSLALPIGGDLLVSVDGEVPGTSDDVRREAASSEQGHGPRIRVRGFVSSEANTTPEALESLRRILLLADVAPLVSGQTLVRGLPLGPVVVSLEREDSAEGDDLARAEAMIVPGKVAHVTLGVTAASKAR